MNAQEAYTLAKSAKVTLKEQSLRRVPFAVYTIIRYVDNEIQTNAYHGFYATDVNLFSFKQVDSYNFKEIFDQLVAHYKNLGFTLYTFKRSDRLLIYWRLDPPVKQSKFMRFLYMLFDARIKL